MYRFFVTGVVQGVGFRPFIYNEALKAGLNGYVQNVGNGVVIVADAVEPMQQILSRIPGLARLDSVTVTESSEWVNGFHIKESGGKGYAEVPPDVGMCHACVRELFDPSDRRYGYFFVTCTHCGPRFSITRRSPYDRETTAMGEFPMCDACRQEYTTPNNRRYHAQTIACHRCGPTIFFQEDGKIVGGIKEAMDAIQQGCVIAIKGIGGFHLACALHAVSTLRTFTGRPHKPYAIMVSDLAMLRTIAAPTEKECALLQSPQRPIVLVKKKAPLRDVSELDTIGVMLPYTALHCLLFVHYDQPLVMTSANLPDDPITHELDQQFVPKVLSHTRKIEMSIDDSVVKVVRDVPLLLRRSRGYVPQSIPIGTKQCLLALGADMGNTICIAKDGRAYLSQYLGNIWNPHALNRFQDMIRKLLQLLHAQPSAIIGDLHPQFMSTGLGKKLAEEWTIPFIPIQHHLAHVYGVAAEHGLSNFVGIACDGIGYGSDGMLWGGEVFDNGIRVGHLEPQLQPSGDGATQYPERMAFSILRNFLSVEHISSLLQLSAPELSLLDKQCRTRFNAPLTTSCGRVLDAAAALLGLCRERTYDGRPAMLLEAYATEPYDLEPVSRDNVLMTTPLFKFLVDNLMKDRQRLAATVQLYLAKGLFLLAQRGKPIVFAGGCAYNHIMTSYLLEKGVLVNKNVPCGDGGISFGQVAYQSVQAASQQMP